MLLTSFDRSPSIFRSSLGFTVASFIDKNCKKKKPSKVDLIYSNTNQVSVPCDSISLNISWKHISKPINPSFFFAGDKSLFFTSYTDSHTHNGVCKSNYLDLSL
jgi:hypothetical protein